MVWTLSPTPQKDHGFHNAAASQHTRCSLVPSVRELNSGVHDIVLRLSRTLTRLPRMNASLTRKKFLVTGGIAAIASLLNRSQLLAQAVSPSSPPPSGSSPGELPNFPERGPQLEPAKVKRFVIAGHVNLPIVKEMLAADPGLINGAWDWGNGDFETALGGASHMGRRDIAEFLLEHNARMDVFAAAMLGRLEIVKAAVAAFPGIVRVPGPHGIPLIVHAEKGGPSAVAVLDFLRPFVG